MTLLRWALCKARRGKSFILLWWRRRLPKAELAAEVLVVGCLHTVQCQTWALFDEISSSGSPTHSCATAHKTDHGT